MKLTLKIFILMMALNTSFLFADCSRTIIFEGKSDYLKDLSLIVINKILINNLYDFSIPSRDEVADFTINVHDVSISIDNSSSRLKIMCEVELTLKDGRSLGKLGSVGEYPIGLSNNKKMKYLWSHCGFVMKKFSRMIRACDTFSPPI